MSIPAVVLAAFICGLLGVHIGPDDATDAARRQIQALYAKRSLGASAHDIRALLDILAPGFSFRYVQGPIANRKVWEDGLRARMDEADAQARRAKQSGGQWKNPERVATVIQKIAVHGDRATVTALTTTTNTASYPQGLAYTAVLEETSEDTWVKTALGWRLLTIEQVRNKTITDEVRTKPAPIPSAGAKR